MSSHHILLVSTSSGGGHVRAAQAIEKTAALSFPDMQITHIDLMDYVGMPMRKAMVDSYEFMIKQIPELWGFLYNKSNTTKKVSAINALIKQIKRANASEFYTFVRETKPSYILATHLLPIDLLANGPNKWEDIRALPRGLVVTDYDIHEMHAMTQTDHFFVATDKMRWKLERRSVPREDITVSGIPVDPQFFETRNKTEIQITYTLPDKQKTILILSGGEGFTHIDEVIKSLFSLNEPMNIIAVAGKNATLLKKLEKITPPTTITYRPIGWTNAMRDLMEVADVIVTKPGGLTTTECLTLNKPLIMIYPIPGQEEHNVEYVLENDMGVVARNAEDLAFAVLHPPTLSRPTKESTQHAAKTILETIQKELQ